MCKQSTRYLTLLVICLGITLVACAPTALPSSTGLPPDSTQPATSEAPPTPTAKPAPGGESGPSELKYRLLAEFPDIFFCDRDFYPVPVGDELELALQRFPELEANGEEFNAILAHNNMTDLTTFSDQQKLLIYREHKKLGAIQFEAAAGGYRFKLQVAQAGGAKLSGELISGMIDNQGEITVKERKDTIATCPICLAAGTLIDTPRGPLPV